MRPLGFLKGMAKGDVSAIPMNIHQIWINRDPGVAIPEEWLEWSKSWKKFNPEWNYRLWQTKKIEAFMAEKYPDLVGFYNSFESDVQKSDVARLLLLDAFGGIYADLDMECLRPLDELIKGRTCIACCESRRHSRLFDLRRMLCTNYIASAPGHPFLAHTVREMVEGIRTLHFVYPVMESTGPLMFTRALNSYRGDDVDVVGAKVACPFHNESRELDEVWRRGPRAEKIKRKCVRRGTYGIHYWSNSWGRGMAGLLRNPNPHSVPGYRFYPGWESYGCDLVNVGRDIDDLVRECNRREDAVGFSTSGFIKYRVRRRSNWYRVRALAGNEGLYVKESRLPLMKYFIKSYASRAVNRLQGLSRPPTGLNPQQKTTSISGFKQDKN